MAQLDSIMTTMECPVCYEVLRPPIRVCENGHAVCGDCHEKMEQNNTHSLDLFVTCPLCRCGFQLAPSQILEVIYDHMKVACKNHGEGCRMVDSGYLVSLHERKCKFGPRTCPKKDEGCGWEGPLTSLTRHYVDNHAS